MLEDIISTSTGNEFVTFEITGIAPISVTKKYAGIGASLVARIKNTKTPFSIDFGVGDVIVPNQEKRRIPTQLEDFVAPTVIHTLSKQPLLKKFHSLSINSLMLQHIPDFCLHCFSCYHQCKICFYVRYIVLDIVKISSYGPELVQ